MRAFGREIKSNGKEESLIGGGRDREEKRRGIVRKKKNWRNSARKRSYSE